MSDALGPRELTAAMLGYRDALAADQATINRLNVFPVPDGDTGTNMLLTVESVVAALDAGSAGAALDTESAGAPVSPGSAEPQRDMAAVASLIGRAALMGARGNSGVILCQVLRAFSSSLAEPSPAEPSPAEPGPAGASLAEPSLDEPSLDEPSPAGASAAESSPAGASAVAHALQAANEAARSAVMQPAEGTILTVAAAAATGALAAAEAGAGLVATLEAARAAALEALWRTPEQLPVLASAGVVDAGGAGLVLLFDGLLRALDGRPLPGLLLPDDVRRVVEGGRPADGAADLTASQLPTSVPHDLPGELAGCRYEVMYLLEAPDTAIPAFREVWAGLGESIVVVGGDGLWSCHIHTDEIGASIEAALDAGRPRQIRVTDLAEQVEEESWVREGAARAGGEAAASTDEVAPAVPRTTQVVAVASGDGIRRIFRSLGVEGVVAGGQSMNPSTAEVLEVIERARSREVVVLPNNSNIVPVAEQAAVLSDKHVVVVPTRAIQEGFAALLEYDPQAEAEENAARMKDAARRVVTGEVTRAVRSADSAAGPVAPGDWIGLDRDGIVAVSGDLAQATCDLLARVMLPGLELVTLFEGAGATAAATRRVSEWLAANHPGVELERHVGGQPLYPYLVTVE